MKQHVAPRIAFRAAASVASVTVSALVLAVASPLVAQTTTRVSVTSSLAQVVGHSEAPAINHDGRHVAFYSRAPLLVPDDTNNLDDVFVHDRYTGSMRRVSVSSAGVAGNGASDFPALSADGRYVAFRSASFNLDPVDDDVAYDIFVHDLQTGTTELMSKNSAGLAPSAGNSASPAISANGIYVAFQSDNIHLVGDDSNGMTDVFVHNRVTGTTERVNLMNVSPPPPNINQATGPCYTPSISGDGRYVVFAGDAGNLVVGDNNSARDIFLRDRLLGSTIIVSRSSAGVLGDGNSTIPVISADGTTVAFESTATNLVPGDTNNQADVFVRDLASGITTRVSVSSSGAQGNLFSREASLSSDGRYVAFHSVASNLVAGDTNSTTDIFVHDRQTGITKLVSVATGGGLGDKGSELPALSGDARFIAFDSSATNLVPGDTNNRDDVFVTDPSGCAGSIAIRSGAGNVPSSLTANSVPLIGNIGFGLVYDNPTSSCGVGAGSFVVTAIDFNGALSLPLFDGCAGGSGTLLVNIFGALPALTISGVWSGVPGTVALPLPNDATLCGVGAHGQSFFVVLPSLAIHPSDAVDIVVGQ